VTVAAGTGGFAGAVGLALLLAGWRRGRPATEIAWDLAAWAGLAALTGWLYAPYLRGVLVGAGDAYHYALQVADMATQVRAGHFPVFVGQSAYAFSGNVHTLRTAPYLLHFAALLDVLTRHRMSAAGLLDLALALHAVGLALAAWRVGRSLIGPEHPACAFALAALYALSPAIAGTVLAHDLVATFLALPWLPLLVWAIVRLLEDRDPWPAALTGTWALALIWWAHPPVAAWSTALWAGAWVVALARRRAGPAGWIAAAVCAAGLAAMTGYCFVSVLSLDLGASFGPSADIRVAILRSVRTIWPGFVVHPWADPSVAARPGYALWIAGAAAVLVWRGRSAAVNWLLASTVVLLLFLGAMPFATSWLWNLVPDAVVRATHDQPVQRLAALLAALLLASAALGVRRVAALGRPARTIAAWGLVALAAWSVQAIGPARRIAASSTRTPAETAAALDPRNVYLMWASYGVFAHLPNTFTHGRTAAPWEVRLLQDERGVVVASNAAAVVAAAQARGELPVAMELAPSAAIPTRPDRGYVLEFSFAQPAAKGQVEFFGQSLHRNYALPSSGEPAAFGAAPGNSRLLGFEPDEHDGRAIRAQADVPGVSVRAYPFDPASLPLQVQSLMPLRVQVTADAPAWLETPRSWVPGYRATVDGADVPLGRSPEGFVMLPVPAGRHLAEVRYMAPPALKTAYGISLLTLAGWMASLPLVVRRRTPAAAWTRRRAVVFPTCGFVILLGAAAAWEIRRAAAIPVFPAVGSPAPPATAGGPAAAPGSGAVRLAVVFPALAAQPAEPLVLTGKTGAADIIYVHYLPGHCLQLGFDHWGVGGPLSTPLEYTSGVREEIEVEQAALFDGRPGTTPAEFRDPAHSRIVVRWNGKAVLDFEGAVHPGQGGACVLGANSVGATSCAPAFSGTILGISRFLPGEPPESRR
jgi:hypothetical protein